MARRAVVLMNLGGPDSLDAVKPFLRNLFSDPAIINLPAVLRLPLAWLIASRRTAAAREIYEHLGGRSPLLPNTQAQADALEAELGQEYRCFIAMRYWHPFTGETVATVKAWHPDEIILLPLYPQFSTTTTASSFAEWRQQAARQGLDRPTREVRSYPYAEGFIAALADAIGQVLAVAIGPTRILFSAHGLPQKIVDAGDRYPDDIRTTAEAVVKQLGRAGLDWDICYQSRVGPLAWLRPSVAEELHRAARDKVGVVVAPVSFVSEHSETLVELDRDYRRVAEAAGVPSYRRVPTVGTDYRFIAALAGLVRGSRLAAAMAAG